MLRLENISVSFDHDTIIKDLTCEVHEGDFITIVGFNGAGKTTLFDIITGKIKPDSGRVILDGKDITQLSEQERAPFFSRLFQNIQYNIVPSMTVAENLALAAGKGKPASFAPGTDLFPQHLFSEKDENLHADIESWLHRPMHFLSGGQAQIVAFIMATLIPPRLLLLDEPTAALDPVASTKMLSFAVPLIREKNITTLLITHEPDLALHLGNKLWVMENGVLKKQYNQKEKQTISGDDLLGHIDYARILKN